MRRREFIAIFGGSAIALPLVTHAQQTTRLPTVGGLLLPPLREWPCALRRNTEVCHLLHAYRFAGDM
jgi:hypothetical protein